MLPAVDPTAPGAIEDLVDLVIERAALSGAHVEIVEQLGHGRAGDRVAAELGSPGGAAAAERGEPACEVAGTESRTAPEVVHEVAGDQRGAVHEVAGDERHNGNGTEKPHTGTTAAA